MVPTPCVLQRGSTKQSVDVAKYNAPRPLPFAQAFRQHQTPLSGGRMESAWRGVSGMDAARGLGVPAIKGHGWPLYAGPRNVDEMREVSRSETRMQGQACLLTFFATEKSESRSRANPAPHTGTTSGSHYELENQPASRSRLLPQALHPTQLPAAQTKPAAHRCARTQ